MIDLVDSDKLHIFPLSDFHYGSSFFNDELFVTWKKEFESVSGNKIIYLLGDMVEFPTTRVNAYDSSLSTEDSINKVLDMFKPYEDYILFVASGNHELRGKKDFNLDVSKIFAKEFDAIYTRNDFFHTININGKKCVVYGKHGTNSSKYPDLAMKNFKIDMGNIDANIYLHAHNHYCEFSQKFQRDANGGYLKHFVFTGHFMNYHGSYAHNKGLTVSPPSFMRIDVDRDLNVGFKKFTGRCKV